MPLKVIYALERFILKKTETRNNIKWNNNINDINFYNNNKKPYW